MNKEEFATAIDKIYFAIRQVEGYTDEGDRLVDLLGEMADVCEDKITEE